MNAKIQSASNLASSPASWPLTWSLTNANYANWLVSAPEKTTLACRPLSWSPKVCSKVWKLEVWASVPDLHVTISKAIATFSSNVEKLMPRVLWWGWKIYFLTRKLYWPLSNGWLSFGGQSYFSALPLSYSWPSSSSASPFTLHPPIRGKLWHICESYKSEYLFSIFF